MADPAVKSLMIEAIEGQERGLTLAAITSTWDLFCTVVLTHMERIANERDPSQRHVLIMDTFPVLDDDPTEDISGFTPEEKQP